MSVPLQGGRNKWRTNGCKFHMVHNDYVLATCIELRTARTSLNQVVEVVRLESEGDGESDFRMGCRCRQAMTWPLAPAPASSGLVGFQVQHGRGRVQP